VESPEMVINIKNETYTRIVKPANIGAGKKLLEVGCAQGHGIRVVRPLGCEYFGVDLNVDAIEFAKSQYLDGNFINGVLRKEIFGNTKFDFVLMIDFIEHVRNPNQEIALVAAMLNDNGKLILSTPRSKSLIHRITGRYWPQYREEHLTYFSKTGIVKILERNGFLVEAVKPTFKVMSPNYFYGQSTQYSPSLVKGLAYIMKLTGNLLHIRKVLLPFGEMTVIATLVGAAKKNE
jgi:2-polyprenyl-3-methyl-5-hydroxy-6-metoxy-1,4-benzoquinol methylase